MSAYKFDETPENQRKWFILSGFPQVYIKEVVKLTYPDGYVACFMDNCTNFAVWGHYADGHKGVCLKFRTYEVNGSSSLDLKSIIGWGSEPIYGYRTFPFRKINYRNLQFPKIDFFRSIGSLPVDQLINQWYTDQYGNISKCGMHLRDKETEETWRKNYWDNYDYGYFSKLIDWEYEQEQRLLLSSSLGTYNESKNRKLQYKFEDLGAIIFGMRTPDKDKVKIKRIIENKCNYGGS